MIEFLELARVSDTGSIRLEPWRLTPDEAAEMAALLMKMEPWRSLGYDRSALSRYLVANNGDKSIAILDSGKCVGLIQLRESWLMGPFIALFAVFPGNQRRGVGQASLGILERDWCPGAKNIWLTVSKSNDAAQQFYQRCGFVSIAQLDDLVRDGCDEILMRKRMHTTKISPR